MQKSCFRDNGTVLRVFEQASRDGRKTRPLKHRKVGEYRDIPVPAYLWEMVKGLPDGYSFMTDGKVPTYSSYRHGFNLNASKAGIPEAFTPHSLRHAFVSALLSHGVPITDVAAWLGHRNINVTYAIYGHLVPSSLGRPRKHSMQNTRNGATQPDRKVTARHKTGGPPPHVGRGSARESRGLAVIHAYRSCSLQRRCLPIL